MNETETACCAKLVERLQSDDPDIIREAAFEAGELKVKAAVDSLAEHIQSDNLGIQEAAEFALRQIRGARVVQAVSPLLRSENASIRNSAMDILREVGADDMKTLMALLHDEDADIRIFAADILGTSGKPMAVTMLAEVLLHDAEVNVRYQAGISLGVLGFSEAAESLRSAMKDEEWVQFAAVEALAKIRDDSCVSILINALKDSSLLVASTIISALGEMGNMKAVPLLLKQLDVVSGPLRNHAVKAIVQILGAPSLELLSPKEQESFRTYLLVAMEDEDEEILSAALTGLSVLGDAEGTSAVLELLKRIDPVREHELYEAALHCLVSIGFNEALQKGLRVDNEVIREACMQACGEIGNRQSLDELKSLFDSVGRDGQRTIMEFLAQRGDQTDVPFFLEVLGQHADSHVIKNALLFLGNHADAVNCSAMLLSFLEHPYDDVKETALDACLQLHDAAVNAHITDLRHDAVPVKRMMAVYAMGRIGVMAYLDDVLEALEDEVPDVRKVALAAIGEACDEHPELLSKLLPRLHDENRDVRLALVSIAGAHDSEESLRLLVLSLQDQDSWVKIRAVESLGRKRVPDVVPTLVQMVEGSELLVMLKVIEALGAIGGNVAFRALLGLTSHEDPDVQQAVESAISQIQEEQGVEC